MHQTKSFEASRVNGEVSDALVPTILFIGFAGSLVCEADAPVLTRRLLVALAAGGHVGRVVEHYALESQQRHTVSALRARPHEWPPLQPFTPIFAMFVLAWLGFLTVKGLWRSFSHRSSAES